MRKMNFELDNMLQTLYPLLEHRGVLGMVAARNARAIAEALKEYSMEKNDLIKRFGHETEDGFSVSPDDEGFADFIEALTPYGDIEQEVSLMTIPIEKAMDELTGTEMLALDWMFEEGV